MSSPIVLIFGAGANIGVNVAKEFVAGGYKAILTSRKAPTEPDTRFSYLQGDLADPGSVREIFSKVRSQFGEPSVVVYNAAAVSFTAADDPFVVDLPTFEKDLNINTTSTFIAIKESLASFKSLPETASRTFIYTGNAMNFLPFNGVMTLGAGKSASAHMIASAAAAYAPKGYKFYYADERKADGRLSGKTISGEAHGQFYKKISEDKTQGPWLQTFVPGKGYVAFPADTDVSLPPH
ncbi:short-chain dehydrogenase [Talaromyces pinophilus]|uniref:Short-chain dehydrogenase n=1 Tax=Talaromyces pinophilus TaxID=128442 RepID=A0A478EC37_TALPI|nr:Short-chain dehydrogenase/reductase SDR [Penicillium occitanis (nom. inval.)]PCG88659.1 hypothetical protein PENOC_109980 [Penicillium occitanis (nom. inval.)]GAM42418.1 short-chain dehydrogenase [Talaromyces pinophilus]